MALMKYSRRSLTISTIVMVAILQGCSGTSPQGSKPLNSVVKDNAEESPVSENADLAQAKSYDSPEAVFTAYRSAVKNEDWETAFDCLTESAMVAEIFELHILAGAEGSDALDRYVDEEQLKKLLDKEGDPNYQQVMRTFRAVIKDKRACYLDGAKAFSKQIQKRIPEGPLRNPRITGNRAVAVATGYIETVESIDPNDKSKLTRAPYDAEIMFAKEKSGWRIDWVFTK
jgi:hypothetical protein